MPITVKPTPLAKPFTDDSLRPSEILAQQTANYWDLHITLNNRTDKVLNMGQALRMAANLRDNVGPTRPLASQVSTLAERLIEGYRRRKAPKQLPNNIRVLNNPR